jgi:hypothetical protein
MTRIPTYTVEDAPAASRSLLQKIIQSTPTVPREPACPDGAFSSGPDSVHVAMRRACRAQHLRPEGGRDTDSRNGGYRRQRLHDRYRRTLAHTNGWTEEQITALRTGTPTRDAKIDVLIGPIREAVASSGSVTDATWKAAQQAGWSDEQLTDAKP